MHSGNFARSTKVVILSTAVSSLFGRPRETGGLIGSLGVRADPSLYPEARYVLYQVLIRNASSQPLTNARIVPEVVKGQVKVRDAPKIVSKLGPNSSGTATFKLEPIDEVGLLEIEGFITFSRERQSSRLQLPLPRVSFDFTMPQLVRARMTHEHWKERVSRYFSEENLFISNRRNEETLSIATKVFQTLGLSYFTRFKGEEGYAAERRDFFGIDKNGRGYAARILWRYPLSRKTQPTLLARVFSETEDGLFSLCHRAFRRLSNQLQTPPTEAETTVPGSDQPQF